MFFESIWYSLWTFLAFVSVLLLFLSWVFLVCFFLSLIFLWFHNVLETVQFFWNQWLLWVLEIQTCLQDPNHPRQVHPIRSLHHRKFVGQCHLEPMCLRLLSFQSFLWSLSKFQATTSDLSCLDLQSWCHSKQPTMWTNRSSPLSSTSVTIPINLKKTSFRFKSMRKKTRISFSSAAKALLTLEIKAR